MKGLMDAKLFLKNNMSCLVRNYSKSSKENPEKTLFTIPKMSAPENYG